MLRCLVLPRRLDVIIIVIVTAFVVVILITIAIVMTTVGVVVIMIVMPMQQSHSTNGTSDPNKPLHLTARAGGLFLLGAAGTYVRQGP